MLADAVVNALVVAAEDDDVLLAGKLVGDALVQDFAIRGGVDDLVVMALFLKVLNQVVDRFDHHHHAGVSAVAVIVYLAVKTFAVFADTVDMNLHETLVDGAFYNRVAERALEQFRNYGEDVDSHAAKIGIYFIKKVIFAF